MLACMNNHFFEIAEQEQLSLWDGRTPKSWMMHSSGRQLMRPKPLVPTMKQFHKEEEEEKGRRKDWEEEQKGGIFFFVIFKKKPKI